MNANWIEVRLDRIEKKLAVLQRVAYTVSTDIEIFIDDTCRTVEDYDEVNGLIYGQESVDGLAELLCDLQSEVATLSEQVTEQRS